MKVSGMGGEQAVSDITIMAAEDRRMVFMDSIGNAQK